MLNLTNSIEVDPLFPGIKKFGFEYLNDFSFTELLKVAQFCAIHNFETSTLFFETVNILNTHYVDNTFTDLSLEQRKILADLDLFFLSKPEIVCENG